MGIVLKSAIQVKSILFTSEQLQDNGIHEKEIPTSCACRFLVVTFNLFSWNLYKEKKRYISPESQTQHDLSIGVPEEREQ